MFKGLVDFDPINRRLFVWKPIDAIRSRAFDPIKLRILSSEILLSGAHCIELLYR